MINTAAKYVFAITVVAFGVAIGYGIAVGDRAGTLLLYSLGFVSLLLGLAVAGSGAKDYAPYVAEDAPVVEVPVGRAAATRPSPWPIAAGVAATVGAVGLAAGAATLYVGIILICLAALGWLLHAWREHPTWTRHEDARFLDRVVRPLAVPIGAVVLILIIVVSVSRVLLAVNEHVSVVVAAVVAVFIFAAFAFVASRPRTGRNVMAALAGVTIIAVAGAGVAGAAKGPREFENKGAEQQPGVIVAKNTQFNKNQLTLRANTNAQLLFRNEDPGVYHNVSVWTQEQGGKPIQAGEPLRGVEKKLYTFKLAPGTYGFRCDFHANMVGTLVAQ